MFETFYVIRLVKGNHYQVTKFTDRKEPAAVYDIMLLPRDASCSCPASYRSARCKHIGMVEEWIKQGKPLPAHVLFKDPDAPSTGAKQDYALYEMRG